MLSPKFADRIDGVGFPCPLHLNFRDVERWVTGDREPDHFVAISCWGKQPISLVGRLTSGNEKDAVDVKLFAHLACNRQVAIVNRVKTAAEKSELHSRYAVGGVEGLPVLQNNEVITMDDFLVFLRPDLLLNVLGLEAFHAA